ncbi:MAG: putative immunity protein [Chthoniobacterales bacterium]
MAKRRSKIEIKSRLNSRLRPTVTRESRAHRLLALNAAKQAERVVPMFEKERANDDRPRRAVEAIRAWARGQRELGMAEVRRLALGSHAAARLAKTDAARFAARAAGHAGATWHVPTHATAVIVYVRKAILANQT